MRLAKENERLIDSFVNAVYLYEDKIILTFNYKDGSKTITLAEVEGSDLSVLGAPCRGGFRDQEPVRQSERVLNFVLGMTAVAVFVRISIFNSVTAFRYYSNY